MRAFIGERQRMNKLKNNAWFRKVGMALLDIVLILLSVYLLSLIHIC